MSLGARQKPAPNSDRFPPEHAQHPAYARHFCLIGVLGAERAQEGSGQSLER
eukprot:CAMPEP_0118857938 /NCGR_PEP_ID=MMETSP1163-20130328/4828_1 /TAXON_ID=124430 /ORGANISM="Phaeomonas parva, Strain CCMP2877" /LENGTH=51 /DNA_ID=CAMNT_0006791321 /DNA_START=1 /DNA_END=153 /DNA_ORIENTATION=-